jgi:predicted ATPase/DNA-binding XRE family transcriptional regulator
VATQQQTFGTLLRRYRLMAGLTQEGLAERAGLSLRGVSDLERGLRRVPYPDTVERLITALGLGPAERQALHAARRTAPAVSRTKDAPLESFSSPPVPLTSFIGRERELREIHQLLARARLVTVVGAGGAGKTRLVLEASRGQSAKFADGVHFVALAGVASSSLLSSTLGTVLRLSFYGSEDPRLQLVRYLRDRELLLVLDNFEHLLDDSGLLTEILSGASGVRILVTSRERMNLHEEWVLQLDGLAFPDRDARDPIEQYPAVRLFMERARQVQADFSIADHARAVIDISRRVEGLPLAIELATGWLRAMPCEQIAEQIERDLDFLTTSVRNVPERHRSLRAVFDRSWRLLSEAEQQALMSLSVFRGGFEAEAAKDVAGASLPLLAGLIDKSLVRRTAPVRYDVHELLRQYLSEKLIDMGAASAISRRHFDHYSRLAHQAEAQLYGPKQEAWFDRLQVEHDNIAAALTWSVQENQLEDGLRLASALGFFWEHRGYFHDAHEWFENLLGVSRDVHDSVRAKAMRTAGVFAMYNGDVHKARALCEQSLRLARETGDTWNVAWSLASLGFFQIFPYLQIWGDPAGGVERLEEALQLFRGLGDGWGISHVLRRLAWFLTILRDYDRAAMLAREAVTLARNARNQHAIAWSLFILGNVIWLHRKDAESARPLFDESLTLARKTRDRLHLIYVLTALGQLAQERGNHDESQSRYEEAATLVLEQRGIDYRAFDSSCVVLGFAQLSMARGDPHKAARLFGSASAVLSRPYLDFGDRDAIDRDMAVTRRQLGESVFLAEFDAGRGISIEDALTYAVQARACEFN